MNIQPIKLLRGTHADTGQTGQGCFMNVIAYLNGEPQITDQSPCVCPTIRPIAIVLNDFLDDEERQQLLPYIMRAMGSATDDLPTLVARAQAAARFAKRCAKIAAAAGAAAASAKWAAGAARAAGASVEWAARAESAEWAARDAVWAARDARAAGAARADLLAACLQFLDEACPPASEPTQQHIERAKTLVALASQGS